MSGGAAAIRPLVAAAAAHYTAIIGFRISVALALVQQGLSPATIGVVLATFALVPMLLGVRSGQLVDRLGVERPMRWGTALAGAGALAVAALPHPTVIAVAAGVVGVGTMGFHLGMQHACGEVGGPERRTANFNLLTMSFSISGLSGPPVAGLLIDLAGHRAAFALSGVLLAVVWLGLGRYPFDRHVPRRPAAPDDGAPVAQAPARGATAAFELLGTPRIRRLLVASLLASASWDVYQFVLPLHAHAIGLSAASVGLSIAAFSAGSLSVRLVLPKLVERLHPAAWMRIALAVCVLAYAAAPFADSLPMLLALSFLVGTGPGIAQPLTMAALHRASPPGRAGEAAGLRMTLMSATQLALPVGLGLVAGVLGTAPLFWLYAGAAAAIGIVLARADRR